MKRISQARRTGFLAFGLAVLAGSTLLSGVAGWLPELPEWELALA